VNLSFTYGVADGGYRFEASTGLSVSAACRGRYDQRRYYMWGWEPIGETAGEIHVQFSAPISSYGFQVMFVAGTVNPMVGVGLQSLPTITWQTVPGSGYVMGGELATVSGTAPDVTAMDIGVWEDSQPTGNLFPLNFYFRSLTAASSGIQETPEPATIWLALPIVGKLGKLRRPRSVP